MYCKSVLSFYKVIVLVSHVISLHLYLCNAMRSILLFSKGEIYKNTVCLNIYKWN